MLRAFTTDDYQGLIWLSWKFLCLGRRLLCYHIVLSSCMHGSWPRTERFALVRLRIRRTTQSKDRDEFFFFCCLFYEYWEDGSFHHVLLGAGPLVGKEKRSKLAAILLLPGYPLLFLLLVPCCFCLMYSSCRDGTPVPHLPPGHLIATTDTPTLTRLATHCVLNTTDLNWKSGPQTTPPPSPPPPTTGRCSLPSNVPCHFLLSSSLPHHY
jgi:hypothetical protein